MGSSGSKTIWGDEDLLLAHKSLDSGNLNYHKKQYIEALHHYETALSLKHKYLKDDDPLLAISYLHIGAVYQRLNSNRQAIKFYEKALNTYNKNLEKKDKYSLETIKVCRNIARLYEIEHKFMEALYYQRQALDLILKYYKRQDPTYASVHYSLGLLYKKMKSYEHAAQHFLTYIHVVSEQKDFDDSQLLIRCYQFLGQIFKLQNKPEKALLYYHKCLEQSMRFYGEHHIQTSVAHSNLALAQKDCQEFELAFGNMLKCLKIELQLLERKSSQVELTIQGLSMLCKYYPEGANDFYLTLKNYKTLQQNSIISCSTNDETKNSESQEEELEKEINFISPITFFALKNKKGCSNKILDCSFFSICGASVSGIC